MRPGPGVGDWELVLLYGWSWSPGQVPGSGAVAWGLVLVPWSGLGAGDWDVVPELEAGPGTPGWCLVLAPRPVPGAEGWVVCLVPRLCLEPESGHWSWSLGLVLELVLEPEPGSLCWGRELVLASVFVNWSCCRGLFLEPGVWARDLVLELWAGPGAVGWEVFLDPMLVLEPGTGSWS